MALTGTHAAGDTGKLADDNLRDTAINANTAAIATKTTPADVDAKIAAQHTTDNGTYAPISGGVTYVAAVLPERYGAIGDGVTDDTAAINSAITAATTGSTVLILAGKTYMVNAVYNTGGSIRAKTGVNIRVEGTLKAISNTSANSAVILSENASNYAITGSGTIAGERAGHVGTGEGGMCIRIEGGANISISGVTLKDGFGDGMYVGILGATAGTETQDLRVTGVRVANNRRNGVSVTGGIGITFIGCVFEDTIGTDPQSGIDLEPNAGTIVRAVTITGNAFRNNYNYGVQTTANTSDVTITGNVFDGPHVMQAIRLAGNDAVVSGNTIRGGAQGIYAGIAPRSTITGNRVSATTGRGISVSWSDDSIVTGNAVIDAGAAGIYLRGQTDFICSNNIITRCGGTTENALVAFFGSGYTNGPGIINGNVITDAALHGIQCGMPNLLITGNVIAGASKSVTGVSYGIHATPATTVTDCQITGNRFTVGSAAQQMKYGVMVAAGVLRTDVLRNTFGPGAILTANVRNDDASSTLVDRALYASFGSSQSLDEGISLLFVTAAGATTQTLPSAVTSGAGRLFTIKVKGAGTVTVASAGGTIDSGTTLTTGQSGRYVSDGTNWCYLG